jgi:hypothetical protein
LRTYRLEQNPQPILDHPQGMCCCWHSRPPCTVRGPPSLILCQQLTPTIRPRMYLKQSHLPRNPSLATRTAGMTSVFHGRVYPAIQGQKSPLQTHTTGGPWAVVTHAVLPMQILQPPELPRNSHGQAAIDTGIPVVLVHVATRGGWRRLAVVDGLVPPVLVADKHEAAAADARVVHAHDADAKGGGDHRVGGGTLRFRGSVGVGERSGDGLDGNSRRWRGC